MKILHLVLYVICQICFPVYAMESLVAMSATYGLFLIDQSSHLWQLKDEEATKMVFPNRFSSVVAGGQHVLALDKNGDVWSLGDGTKGQLGHGDYENKDVLTKIESLKDIIFVTAGVFTSYVLDAYGKVLVFGSGEKGELGTTQIAKSPTPFIVSPLEPISYLSHTIGFSYHIFAVDFQNRVWGWGCNINHRLTSHGNETNFLQPTLCEEYQDTKSIAAGWDWSASFDSKNSLYATGNRQINGEELSHNLVMAKMTADKIIILDSIGKIWYSKKNSNEGYKMTLTLIEALSDIVWLGTNNHHFFAVDRQGQLFIFDNSSPDNPTTYPSAPLVNVKTSFTKSARTAVVQQEEQ